MLSLFVAVGGGSFVVMLLVISISKSVKDSDSPARQHVRHSPWWPRETTGVLWPSAWMH